jgi:hypothetical protein
MPLGALIGMSAEEAKDRMVMAAKAIRPAISPFTNPLPGRDSHLQPARAPKISPMTIEPSKAPITEEYNAV